MAKRRKVSSFFTEGVEDFVSCSGDRYRNEFTGKVLENGVIELVPNGKTDVYAQIQVDAEMNSIPAILARFENGDTSGFDAKPMYGDFTDLPKTYAEFLQRQIDAQRIWDSLDPKVKLRFDNDSNQFFASAGSKEWIDKLVEKELVKEVSDQDPVQVQKGE